MDFDSLKSTISNLTLYDVKAGVRKVQNAVMNFTEMESKVREATNNEPWGASSSLMQEIANGTFNYQQLNEIMPMIYKRFTEKAAEEWRQIYKALQLLEFLIKNGSERVIDDARSHTSLIKMLRQFHFIDMNGKDQGINVRNRSKELCDLLNDVEKIRAERKKARTTRNKYGGIEGGSGGVGSSSGGSRYGGFGSDTAPGGGASGYGQYSGGVYGDGGGFGGEEIEVGTTQARRDRFEEYDEGDADASSSRRRAEPASSAPRRTAKTTAAAAPPPPKVKQPEVDLFSFDDEPVAAPASALAPPQAAASNLVADDDDFDDFQSAPAAPPTSNAFAPPPAAQNNGNMFASISPPPAMNNTSAFQPMQASTPNYQPQTQQAQPIRAQQPMQPSGYQAAQPNYYTSVPTPQSTQQSGSSTPQSLASLGRPAGGIGGAGAQKPKASGDPFASLLGGGASKAAQPAKKVTLGDMAKQQTSAGLWGTAAPAASAPSTQQGGQQKYGGGLDDLI